MMYKKNEENFYTEENLEKLLNDITEFKYRLGVIYQYGMSGFSVNYEKAVSFYKDAIGEGAIEKKIMDKCSAPMFLGWAYKTGNGVKQDLKEALKWYERAGFSLDYNGYFPEDKFKESLKNVNNYTDQVILIDYMFFLEVEESLNELDDVNKERLKTLQRIFYDPSFKTAEGKMKNFIKKQLERETYH